jgi:hypothetical protein
LEDGYFAAIETVIVLMWRLLVPITCVVTCALHIRRWNKSHASQHESTDTLRAACVRMARRGLLTSITRQPNSFDTDDNLAQALIEQPNIPMSIALEPSSSTRHAAFSTEGVLASHSGEERLAT